MAVQIDIGIPEAQRTTIANGLKHLLADTYTLYLKTHNFHWNVTGPQFNSLHMMFMTQYTELWNSVDLIAERVRSLGFHAPGSYLEYSKLTIIKETEGPLSSDEMIRELVKGHEAVSKTARGVFPKAEEGNDEATLDLLTQRLAVHEKTAWMLRSLLEK